MTELPAPCAPARRWLALDVLRACAVLLMVQGHAFTALLAPHAYAGVWSRLHSLLHGLTAPMFLIGGGLAYGLVVGRGRAGTAFRFSRRGCWLLLIGFGLQLPKAPLARILADDELLAKATQVGPLQLIGACLVLCELVRALAGPRLPWVAATGAALVAFLAPWVWSLRVSQGAYGPLGAWLDGHDDSLFPFFPWAAFFLLGVAASRLAPDGSPEHERRATLALQLAGAACVALAYGLFLCGFRLKALYGEHPFWLCNPLFTLFRAGLVLSWLGLIWRFQSALERWFSRRARLEQVMSALARQSLVAYVGHLLVLYGTPFTAGLVRLGATLELAQASAVALALCVFTSLLVLLFQHAQPIALSALRQPFRSSLREVDRVGEREVA